MYASVVLVQTTPSLCQHNYIHDGMFQEIHTVEIEVEDIRS